MQDSVNWEDNIVPLLEHCFSARILFVGKCGWDKLFEPPNFFAKYRHFIVLEASSGCEEDQLQWEGLVESKVGPTSPSYATDKNIRRTLVDASVLQ